MQKGQPFGWPFACGCIIQSDRDRTRTCDPVINSHLLYQLSYAAVDGET